MRFPGVVTALAAVVVIAATTSGTNAREQDTKTIGIQDRVRTDAGKRKNMLSLYSFSFEAPKL